MKRIGMYMHENNYIELFFNEETLKFKADRSGSGNQSPFFDTPVEALNYCRRLIEKDVGYDYELNDVSSVYKTFFNSKKPPTIQTKTDKLDREMWSVDYAFAEWALTRVLYFKIFYSDHGIPGDFVVMDEVTGQQLYVEEEEWEQVLTDIVTCLRLMIEDCTGEDPRIERGLFLFSKYIRAMWT